MARDEAGRRHETETALGPLLSLSVADQQRALVATFVPMVRDNNDSSVRLALSSLYGCPSHARVCVGAACYVGVDA